MVWAMPIAATCKHTSGQLIVVLATAASLLLAGLAHTMYDALRYWQLLRAFPALLLAMAVLATGCSTLLHLSVLHSCAVPDNSTIAQQLAPSVVAGRWQC